jgi:hypothetical protein
MRYKFAAFLLTLLPERENLEDGDSSDRLYGLVVRVPGYLSKGLSSIPGTTIFIPLSLVSTVEELLGRNIICPDLENRIRP